MVGWWLLSATQSQFVTQVRQACDDLPRSSFFFPSPSGGLIGVLARSQFLKWAWKCPVQLEGGASLTPVFPISPDSAHDPTRRALKPALGLQGPEVVDAERARPSASGAGFGSPFCSRPCLVGRMALGRCGCSTESRVLLHVLAALRHLSPLAGHGGFFRSVRVPRGQSSQRCGPPPS